MCKNMYVCALVPCRRLNWAGVGVARQPSINTIHNTSFILLQLYRLIIRYHIYLYKYIRIQEFRIQLRVAHSRCARLDERYQTERVLLTGCQASLEILLQALFFFFSPTRIWVWTTCLRVRSATTIRRSIAEPGFYICSPRALSSVPNGRASRALISSTIQYIN